jgi:NAD(P)-dependent dehydrogenase (short-subunit alcohol dehydrogenase family)
MAGKLRIAIVNTVDDIGSSLTEFFAKRGAEVLGIDDRGDVDSLPPGVKVVAIDTRLGPQALAQAILRGLQEEGGAEILINNFGPGLADVRMAEGQLWALAAPPQVKAAFAATRAFLTLSKQRRALVVNLGLGIGPVDEHCPVRYALLGFAYSLGLMELRNIEAVNLCLHNLCGQQPGRCSVCAEDTLLTSPASDEAIPFEHLHLTGYGQVSELVTRAIDKFRGTVQAEGGGT